MGEPIELGCGHLGIAEHSGPYAEAQVGDDHDAGALIEFAEQMEKQPNFVRLSTRPRHPQADPEAQAAHKNTSPT